VNAGTGTGKTIVYLAPIVHHLQAYAPRINRSDGTLGKNRIINSMFLYMTIGLCLLKHNSSKSRLSIKTMFITIIFYSMTGKIK
jgi:hypothetical protein